MNDQPKHEYAPYICLSTALSIAGGELLEMAGAINERRTASDFNLKRAENAVRKAAASLAEHRRIVDADPVIDWPRPSCHRQAEGLRCEDRLLPITTLKALNGDDGGEAA